MRPVDVMIAWNNAGTPTKRDNVIKAAWKADNEAFFEGLALSVDPNWNIPVSSVPEIQEDDGYEGTFTQTDFDRLTRLLPNMTPDEAKEAIHDAAMESNFEEWNHWYRRILLKNLTKDMDMERLEKLLKKLTT